MISECPECGSQMSLPGNVISNEILDCEYCGVELEVVQLTPPTLALAPEEQEDWGE